jgi:HK97 family phage major capsid protein
LSPNSDREFLMNKFKEMLEAAVKEARTALDAGDKDAIEKARAKVADVRMKYDAEEEMRTLSESIAKNVPAPAAEQRVIPSAGWGEVRNQLKRMFDTRQGGAIPLSQAEIRAITSNGAGVNTAPGIVAALVDGGKLRSKVSVFTGPNAQTVVPVFSPHMAVPVGSVPGATGTSSDATAVLTGDPLTLKPWYSTLAISMGALLSTDIERELPGIFGKAFGAAIDKGILVGAGSGSDMLGVFIASTSGVPTASDITATGSGAAPTWGDYAGMALALLALEGDTSSLAIVVNPAVIAVALGSTAVGDQPLKQEFLNNRTIMGVPVILSSYALTTLSGGSYVAVGGYFDHFALAVAQEIHIDQIKTVGSDNVTFQSFMYLQGKPLIGSSFRRLKTG